MASNTVCRFLQSFIIVLGCLLCYSLAQSQAAAARPNYEMKVWPACFKDNSGLKAQAINKILAEVENWPVEIIFSPSKSMGKERSEKDVRFYATWSLNYRWSVRLNEEIYGAIPELTPENYEVDRHIFQSEIISCRPGMRKTRKGEIIKGYFVTAKAHIKNAPQYNPYIAHEVPVYNTGVEQKLLDDGNLEIVATSSAHIEGTDSIDAKIGRAHRLAVQKTASALVDEAIKSKRCSPGKRKKLIEEISKRYSQGGMIYNQGCGVDAHKLIVIVLDKKGNLVDKK